jgi:hypothetical protein
LAKGLCNFIFAGRAIADRDNLELAALFPRPGGTLWPTPHSSRFDFALLNSEVEHTDELARVAWRQLENVPAQLEIGHLDWRVENLGFADSTLVAIYDWDSVGLATEAFLVGSAAATFPSNWSQPNGALPNLREMRAFLSDYQEARGSCFDFGELRAVNAANLIVVAYGARCQLSDTRRASDSSINQGWVDLLLERGEFGLLDV